MAELDPLIHSDARLRVISALSTIGDGNSITFPRLRDILGMTGGNLSTHLRKLEDAGYIFQSKIIQGRTPSTFVGITPKGRGAFLDYRAALLALLGPANSGPE